MLLSEFYDYKNKLMEDILTNERIVHLINENIPFENAESLAYTQVFPSEYVPDTAEHGKTYVCFDVDIQRSFDKLYLLPTIYIWVFTHRSLMRLPEGGLRVDTICNEICKAINGSMYYGLGRLNFYSSKRFAPITDYNGKLLTFETVDFNRVYDPTKPVPSNRKGK